MIEKTKNSETNLEKECLDKYLQVLEESSSDFIDIKNAYIKASLELKKIFLYTDNILEYNNDIILFEMEFSFNRGLKDNLEHFKNPKKPTFMDMDYNKAIKEEEMRRNPEYVFMVKEHKKLIDLIPDVAEDLYEKIVEYTSLLDVYIPKMAHYYGFLTGNTTFKKAIPGYEPDYALTKKYREWINYYLDLNLEWGCKMLYYKDKRFYIGGLSYSLPEDICIITNYEVCFNNGFAYKSLDQKILVTIDTYNNDSKRYFESEEFKRNNFIVKEVTPFGYAGIKGESAIYYSKNKEYYEAVLNLPRPTKNENVLDIFVEVEKKGIDINTAIKESAVRDLLLSLNIDFSVPEFL